jgi:hypothetical protein
VYVTPRCTAGPIGCDRTGRDHRRIDGREVVTLHADEHGSVSYQIKPSALGLWPGGHVVDLHSMLITTTNAFEYR